MKKFLIVFFLVFCIGTIGAFVAMPVSACDRKVTPHCKPHPRHVDVTISPQTHTHIETEISPSVEISPEIDISPSITVIPDIDVEAEGGKAEIGDITVRGSKAKSESESKSKSDATGIGVNQVNIETPRDFMGAGYVGNQAIPAFFQGIKEDGSSSLGILPKVITRKMARKGKLGHNVLGLPKLIPVIGKFPVIKGLFPGYYNFRKDGFPLHETFDKKRSKTKRIERVDVPQGENPIPYLIDRGYFPIWASKIEGEPGQDADRLLFNSAYDFMNKGMTHYSVMKFGSKEAGKSESDSMVISGSAAENFSKSGVRGDLGVSGGNGQVRSKLEHWWGAVGIIYVPELAKSMPLESKPEPTVEEPELKPVAEEPESESEQREIVVTVNLVPQPAPLPVAAAAETPAVVELPSVVVLHPFNGWEVLNPEVLEKIAVYMTDHPEARLQVESHACQLGSEPYNRELTYKRALEVKKETAKICQEHGIPPERIEEVLFQMAPLGESKPLVENTTIEDGAKNRRTIFRVMGPATGE